ncbi:hypothetical protein B0H12DRAFT_1270517, partial [Mycena haematopus]
ANAYGVWERTTNPLLFNIIETAPPSHRQALGGRGHRPAPPRRSTGPETREAAGACTGSECAGSTNFFKTVEGVRRRWAAQAAANSEAAASKGANTPVEAPKKATVDDTDASMPVPEANAAGF